MWPFFKRKQQDYVQPSVPAARPRPLSFTQILDGMGDFEDLTQHDTAQKIWLPEPAAEAMKELAARNGDSMSEALRQMLAQHCYGVYAFVVMNEKIPGLFKETVSSAMFSRAREEEGGKKRVSTYWVPELGKNVSPIKLWIPARMRRDLQTLADHVGIPLSQYLREIVISRLLGHGTLPKRPEMLKAAPLPSADAWAEEQEVPMREISCEEFHALKHSEGEIRRHWEEK